MNILLLIDVLPFKNSGLTLRLVNIFDELSKSNNIYFFYIGNEEPKEENLEIINKFSVSMNKAGLKKKQFLLGRILNILMLKHGSFVKYRFKEDYLSVRKTIKEFVEKNKIDVIHVFGCFTAQYAADLNGVGKIWDIADSYSLDIKRRMGNATILSRFGLFMCMIRLFNYEKYIIKNFHMVIFVSEIDAKEYRRLNLEHRIKIIPNGVDLEYFKHKKDATEEPSSLIFTGHMSFLPNAEAVRYFLRKIYHLIKQRMPDIKFYIVGADVPGDIKSLADKDGIIVTGKVNDIRVYLEKATIFVNPMISGCGIKNKLLQAMAYQKAIVSTSLGAESVLVTENKDVMLADEPSEFADKVLELIKDNNLRKSLGNEARKAAEANYSWEKALSSYQEIYETFRAGKIIKKDGPDVNKDYKRNF
jgi:glycosyltransferase involved in cell wall biosynthesis